MTPAKPTHAMPPLGAHMSIAGGMERAVARALAAGATALQIFVKNASRWRDRPLRPGEAEAFRAAVAAASLPPVVAHASYLINLASPSPVLANQSREALLDEIERADALGVAGIVLHPGAHMGAGDEAGLALIAGRLDEVFETSAQSEVQIYLENTAGQGTTLGHRFEHLAAIIALSAHPRRLGVCLDTCHTFAAGYPLLDTAEVMATLAEFDKIVGLDRLRVIHANDSKMPAGSRRDRHEHIGQGCIGEAPFAALLRDRRLRKIPFILETPKGDDGIELDLLNLATLRRLASG